MNAVPGFPLVFLDNALINAAPDPLHGFEPTAHTFADKSLSPL
jgi:hypothetical protein